MFRQLSAAWALAVWWYKLTDCPRLVSALERRHSRTPKKLRLVRLKLVLKWLVRLDRERVLLQQADVDAGIPDSKDSEASKCALEVKLLLKDMDWLVKEDWLLDQAHYISKLRQTCEDDDNTWDENHQFELNCIFPTGTEGLSLGAFGVTYCSYQNSPPLPVVIKRAKATLSAQIQLLG